MKRIRGGFIFPSAAYTVPLNRIRNVAAVDKKPEPGDLVYGRIEYIGQHSSLENKEGRIHTINNGSSAVFVYGTRYAPDYYEGFVPGEMKPRADLLSRSGIVGEIACKSSLIADPTQVKILGYVCDSAGKVITTRDHVKIVPKSHNKASARSKMVLCIGTAMNSGKSTAAAACCWALSTMGHTVRGSKITGTASLKDILLMEDNGASPVADFTFFGYPSTYLLDEESLLRIFDDLDLKYANSPKNYWVVEIADGILQRETAMLLRHPTIRSRIGKLVFCAHDAFAAIGGLDILKKEFDLVPDAISGVCSTSPLTIRELQQYCSLPIFDSRRRDLQQIASILL